MQSIFISYRREDSEGQAGRLYDDLAARFGEDRVFMDVARIGAGSDFRKVIEDQVASCTVLLVVIGKRWLDAKDAAGNRRLDSSSDFVRLETVLALKRDGVTVIPVLIGGATMPEAKDLPGELEQLAYRNAAPLSHLRWTSDLDVLVAELRKVLQIDDDAAPLKPTARALAETSRRQGRMSMGVIVGGAAVVIAGSVGAYVAYDQFSDVRVAEREARRLEIEARRIKANADIEAGKKRLADLLATEKQIEAEQSTAEAEKAAEAASAAKAAADAAELRKLAAANASAKEKELADAAALESQRRQEEANRDAAAKAAEAEKVRVAADAAASAAAAKAEQDRKAQADVVRSAALVSAANKRIVAAGGKNVVQEVAAARPAAPPAAATPLGWRLRVSCGGRDLLATGTALFAIERSGDAVVVSERFAGNSGGVEWLVTGRATFAAPQPSYDIPTQGEWKGQGGSVIGSAGLDRVNTRDGQGLAVVSGNVIRFRTDCASKG